MLRPSRRSQATENSIYWSNQRVSVEVEATQSTSGSVVSGSLSILDFKRNERNNCASIRKRKDPIGENGQFFDSRKYQHSHPPSATKTENKATEFPRLLVCDFTQKPSVSFPGELRVNHRVCIVFQMTDLLRVGRDGRYRPGVFFLKFLPSMSFALLSLPEDMMLQE